MCTGMSVCECVRVCAPCVCVARVHVRVRKRVLEES